MTLAHRHKGMKIVAATDAFFVGEGYQAFANKALPCPYMIFLRSRNLFSREPFLASLRKISYLVSHVGAGFDGSRSKKPAL
jgi:hypothetical protein